MTLGDGQVLWVATERLDEAAVPQRGSVAASDSETERTPFRSFFGGDWELLARRRQRS